MTTIVISFVAMFCTGGIRCEKSTSFALAAKVFEPDVPVYHLDGGILAYLDSRHDPNQSKWKGECFVFDQRVALTHGLKVSIILFSKRFSIVNTNECWNIMV